MGLKLLTKLRLGLSHHNEHRFNHNFQSCINPLCSCSLAIESTTHFLLHCHHFSNIRSTLINSINEVLGSTTNVSDCSLVKILRSVDQNHTQVENSYIINATIKYLVDSDGPLQSYSKVHFCSLSDLNDLNVFVITCFFLLLLNPSAYDKLLGVSLCISQVLSTHFSFCFNSCIVIVCS